MIAPIYACKSTAGVSMSALLFLSGCTYAAPRYTISAATVRVLRTFEGKTVAVGDFTAATPGRSDIWCRSPLRELVVKTPMANPSRRSFARRWSTS